MIRRIDFHMFSEILIFDPKWGFCMGYTFCIMAEFQNIVISRLLRFFLERFLGRTTVNDL